jgi:hypothetical protein
MQITWRVWTISVINSLIFAGVYIILPFIFAAEHKGLLDLFWTVLVEIPAVFIVGYLIDKPWMGRIKIIYVGFTFTILALFIIWYYRNLYLVWGLVCFKFFIRIAYLAFNPLVAESYSTVYRSLGIGSCSGVGRIAGAFAPALIFPIY